MIGAPSAREVAREEGISLGVGAQLHEATGGMKIDDDRTAAIGQSSNIEAAALACAIPDHETGACEERHFAVFRAMPLACARTRIGLYARDRPASDIVPGRGSGAEHGHRVDVPIRKIELHGRIDAAGIADQHRDAVVDNLAEVAIYGASSAGMQLVMALRMGREYWPVLFFDDDPALQRIEVAGLRVQAPADLERKIAEHDIDELLLAIPSATRARRLEIIDRLEHLHCKVKLIPGMADVVDGNVEVDAIREVEIEDLLGRESVAPDERLLGQCITGKVVLVSGAGGSIGSELCRQIVRLRPVRLVLFELSEFGLYSIEQELAALCARMNQKIELVPILGTVTHQARSHAVMRCFGVQTVYHAAAYKHVPLVEHNPIEGIRNNAVGTRRMAEAALAAGVETFVLVSTDKAVRPTNVMGASKRLAELILQALARQGGRTRFCMVRFGNVLGSSGSVVPLFRKQIAAGGPITLTHPEITRYFMTIPEAAQLVIQAGSMGRGGEVYVLDMGQPVRIIDLARRMIHLSGLEVRDKDNLDGDIAIETVGLRPGEKLYEELLIGDNVEGTSHPLIMRAYEHEVPWEVLTERFEQLDVACKAFDFEKVLALLGVLVQEYQPARHGDGELLWRSLVGSGLGGAVMH